MSLEKKIPIIVLSIILFSYGITMSTSEVYADSHNIPPISVSTDSEKYADGDTIIMTVNIKNYDPSSGHAFTWLIKSPDNEDVAIGQLVPSYDGSFQVTIVAGGNMWKLSGDYIIEFRYGSDSGETTIVYTGGNAPGGIQNSITVTTDKASYSEGEVVLITGKVRDLYSGTPASVTVLHPDGSLVSISQVSVGYDKKFGTEITAGGALMDIAGTYKIIAQYGNASRSAETTFFYKTAPTNISFTNPRTVDAFGNSLDTVYVAQQVQITADIFNNNNFSQDFFIYHITIRETGLEAWIWGSLSPYQIFSPALSWIPTEPGIFTVDISLFDNMENKNKLSESLTLQILVGEFEEPTHDHETLLTISTDKSTYHQSEGIRVTYDISKRIPDEELIIYLYYDTLGNPISTTTISDYVLSSQLSSVTTFFPVDNRWDQDGRYTIIASYEDYTTIIGVDVVTSSPSYPTPDTTPPKILKPTDIIVDAENQYGARVFYDVLAIDETDQIVRPSCNPSSGSLFEVGKTRIICNARDSSGNKATPISFYVTVNSPEVLIPNWVKEVAAFWCNDTINDESFIEAVQYLIENGVIRVSLNYDSGVVTGQIIPDWVKNNACWWSEDLISDDDFASGLEYLVQQGIIKV
ncbi:MAG: HYR domain-containing protein [Thaumarchaeota archaeon]|nr:HYR domain-containing protein [Nitrososphaerota archaeon]